MIAHNINIGHLADNNKFKIEYILLNISRLEM